MTRQNHALLGRRILAGLACALALGAAPARAQPPAPGGAPAAAASPGDPLIAGCAALEDGLYELAAGRFLEYLASRPDLPPAQVRDVVTLLARARHGQGRFEDVLQTLRPGSGLLKGVAEDADSFVFWRAMAWFELARYDEALGELVGFDTRFPASPYAGRIERLRAWCDLKQGRTAEALAAFAAFDAAHADSPEAGDNLLEWGKALLLLGRVKEAREVLTRLAMFPGDQAAVHQGQLWLGRLLARESDAAAAAVLQTLAESAAASPLVRADALCLLSDVYRAQTNLAAAAEAAKRAMELTPSPEGRRRSRIALGLILLDQGREEEALPVLKEVIAAAPEDPRAGEAQLRVAQYLLRTSRAAQAVDEFQHYVETFTNSAGRAVAYEGKGWGLMELGRYAEAATAFDKAEQLHGTPEDRQRCRFKTGDACFSNGQYSLAGEHYAALLETWPKSELAPNAMFQLAESRAQNGEADAAMTLFQDLHDRYPASPFAEEALLRIAELKADRRQWLDAIEEFNLVMERYPGGRFTAEALHGRGLVRYQMLAFADALRDFDALLSEHPHSAVAEQAFYRRAMCLYWVGRDEESLAACREFMERYPDSIWSSHVLFWIGMFYYNHGQWEDAQNAFLRYAERYPQSGFADAALLRAGMASARRHEYVDAIEILGRMVKEYPRSRKIAEARFEQADAMSQLARCAAAILIYDEIIKKYPDSPLVPAAWGRKGDSQFTLGSEDPHRYEESIESYRVVANSATAPLDLVLQAEYKIGRSLEKLGRATEAFEQYYLKVIVRFLEFRDGGGRLNEAAQVWFTRAAFNAADIMESRKDWRRAVRLLERVVEAGMPAAREAQDRIDRIRAGQWWLFY